MIEAVTVILLCYVTFKLARSFWWLATGFLYKKTSHPPQPHSCEPTVSIIIPAWNESVGIEKTILSVADNTYPNKEIIIVDDGSTDGTSKIAWQLREELLAAKKLRLGQMLIVRKSNAGKAAAINSGLKYAKGDLILTIDADSFINKNTIAKMAAALRNPKFAVAIGEIIVRNTKTLLGKMQNCEYTIGFHVKRSQHNLKSAYIFPGALTMFRKEIFQTIGGFSTFSCTEDLEISMRTKLSGYQVVYVDDAVCYTEGASTVNGLINQRTRWRHGYLQCILGNRDFVFSTKKGLYLSLVDFPLHLLAVIELIIDPLVFGLILVIFMQNASPLSPIIAYAVILFIIILTIQARSPQLRRQNPVRWWIILMPFVMLFLQIVEYIALLKSIYRLLAGQQTKWTIWQRTGAAEASAQGSNHV
jgi:cellulose synthase/poly-beta-1,6-N-acetylglucosamine synthase-like glycosyltransferase